MSTNPIDPKEDGVSHINVYSKSSTELGRFLTNMNNIPVTTVHGEFASAESYWHWLKFYLLHPSDKLDSIKTLDCFASKNLAKQLYKSLPPVVQEAIVWMVQSDEFRGYITDMIKSKILSRPDMVKLMKDNTLPYYHYYYYGTIDNPGVVKQEKYSWMTDYLNKLKLEL